MMLIDINNLKNEFNEFSGTLVAFGCSEKTRDIVVDMCIRLDFIVDNNLSKQGGLFIGVPVISLSKFLKLSDTKVVLWGNHIQENRQQLEDAGFINYIIAEDLSWICEPNYSFDESKDTFLYLPWMRHTGDKLIDQINISDKYDIWPLKISNDTTLNQRNRIVRFEKEYHCEYVDLLKQHLLNVKDRIKGFIFTFDWFPAMRVLSKVCAELGIERFLVLHESVFMDADKYYMNPHSGENTPLAEHILCWGELQRDIFLSRGIEPERLHITGAPKFDLYHDYRPALKRVAFYNIFGLDSNKKTILYAMQLMDLQVDQGGALKRQQDAISDVIEYCLCNDVQLIIRGLPFVPNVSLLSNDLVALIEASNGLYYDTITDVSPEESIFHTDLVMSVNSTMLFEGLLLGKSVISTKYIDFEQIWQKMEIPFATNKNDLHRLISNSLKCEGISISSRGWEWAKQNLSAGLFDGHSADRVRCYLEDFSASR